MPGLNVVLGPNEAGKSTLFSAIRSSLLRTHLKKTEFDRLIARFLPAGGGDVVRLELGFTTPSGAWLLRRQWGTEARSELRLPDGGTLVDEEAIRERLQEELPARLGTFWKVLMTGQAELGRTMESLRADGGDAVCDLADMLRRTVLETGGVPVEAFRSLLLSRLKRSFQHWDSIHGGPEAGRGIEKPWKKEVGVVLAAWYAREAVRARYDKAVEYESSLDALNARLRAVEHTARTAEVFLSVNRKAEQDARNRRTLEAQRAALELEQADLHAVSREWPVSDARAREIERTLGSWRGAERPL